MDLGLDEQQEMLKNFARDFLEKECPESLVREMEEDEKGYSPELWQKMAQQGWMGLIIPENYNGTGMNICELVVLLEEFGMMRPDRKSTRLNSSHGYNSYAVFCLKKKKITDDEARSE